MGLGGGLRTSYQPAEQIEIDLSPLEGTSMVQEEDMYAYGCTCCGVFLDDMHSAHCALRDDEWNPDDRAVCETYMDERSIGPFGVVTYQ
jgi:hypothetical protein